MKVFRKSSADLYTTKFTGSKSGDMPVDFLQRTNSYIPCATCGTPSPWLDLEFGVHICSETCRSILTEKNNGRFSNPQ